MRAHSLTLTLCLSSLAVTGCGGVDRAEYVREVRAVQQAAVRDANAANQAMARARSSTDVERLLGALGADFSEHAAELGSVVPPDEVAGDHRAYVKVFARYGRAFRDLSERISQRTSARQVARLQTEVQRLTRQLAAQETPIVDRINQRLAD